MLGDFLLNYSRIPNDSINSIEDGTVIVAFLRGRFPRFQFGIYFDGNVAIQRYDPKLGITIFEQVSMSKFSDCGQNEIYEYLRSNYRYDKKMCLKRAQEYIGKYFVGFTSVLGDDFTFSCVNGYENMCEMFESPMFGKHFKYKYRESGFLLYHHFLAIEQDYVIHFSSGENPNARTRLLVERLEDVKNRTPYEFEYVEHKDESLESLMTARNRAIFEWAIGKDFNGYNIVTNNCEHFVNYCKTGKKRSWQVIQAVGEIAISATVMWITKKPIPLFFLKNRYIDGSI